MSFRVAEEGAGLLEFALVVPTLILILFGVVDLGLVFEQSILVTQAATAGAAYGTLAGKQNDYSGMTAAATNAANGLSGFSVTSATSWCSCTSAGSAVGCSTVCAGSASPIMYVQVQTSATEPVLVGYPGISPSFVLKGNSILRVQ
jgi:Flp pilus assembly protein TadG